MLRRATRLIAGLFLLLGLPAFAGNNVNIPDWVRQAAAQTLPTYPADTNAVVLLDETTYTINGPGDVTEHSRRVVKILRPEGREDPRPPTSWMYMICLLFCAQK